MNTCVRCFPRHFELIFASAVCALTIFLSVRATLATDSLAYSYETIQLGGPDGVQANGGGTYTQDTIGATVGANSMKASLGIFDTFVGGLTSIINPTPGGAIIGDPPGIDHVTFDLTVASGDVFPGAFAVVGVTVFGCTQAGACGQQRQFFDEEHVDGLGVGTHTDLLIDLTSAHGTGESFNEAFGEAGSGSPLIPTHFQLYFNKSSDAPLTVYIDNVRVGMTTAGVPGDYNGNGKVDGADYVVWRNGGPLQNEVADPSVISPADYTEWRARFGNISGSGSGLSNSAVPEPNGALLLLFAGAARWARRRSRAAQ